MKTPCRRFFLPGALCAVVLATGAADPPATPPSAKSKPAAPGAGAEIPAGAVDRLLEMIRQRQPDEYERLTRLRAEHPAQFESELRRRLEEANRRARERIAARTNAPPSETKAKPAAHRPPAGGVEERVADLMRRIDQAAAQHRRAPAAQREALAEQIRSLVAAAFDLRENDRIQRVNRLQKELERLKEELDQRRSLRDQIIDRKVAEILGTDPTAW